MQQTIRPAQTTGRDGRPSDDPRHRVILDHLALARAMAGRYAGRGVDRDDLTQVAYLGLVKAARRYDPERGGFAAFAAPTVTGELKRHFRDAGWMVRPPRWIQELQVEIRELIDQSLQESGAMLDDRGIAARLKIEVGRVREARGARGCFAPHSLDAPTLGVERPPHESLADLEDAFECLADRASLGAACRRLCAEDQLLLRLRFVDERSQQSIADELGFSQMQVSRRLKRILAELRSAVLADAA